MLTPNHTIGILGGMGPAATADLFQKMLAYIQEKYGAVQDSEYPPILIRSVPCAGLDETGVIDEAAVVTHLIEEVRSLEQQGSDVIVVPCNTVHFYFEEMQSAVNTPILHIGHETIRRVKVAGVKRVGLLCSDTTSKTHFFQQECIKQNIEAIEPNAEQQQKITQVIERIMGGRQDDEDKKILLSISQGYRQDGAEAVVLACTEIPLAVAQSDTDIPLFDSTQILAESAVDFAMKS